MGIKATVATIALSGLVGYVCGRGDGRDIEAYNNAMKHVESLEIDNVHLAQQLEKVKRQASNTTDALNARTKEVAVLREKSASKARAIDEAGKSNSEWGSGRVPDGIANVLRTPSDDADR